MKLRPRQNPYYSGPVSDHFDGVRFFNPGKPRKGGLRQFLKWQLTAKWEEWPRSVASGPPDRPPERVAGDDLRVSFVGHATVLIQTQNLNIITDPVWAQRASPSQRIGPLRAQPPGVDFDTLPPIDVILLSHNHYDHMDLVTLQRIQKRDGARIVTPLGNDTIITAFDASMSAEAHDWDERVALSDDVHVTLDRTHHWSARGVRDRQMALWASFAIGTPGGTIYFVGDSGYGGGDYFRDAFEKFGPFRLAILPIGAYEPRWFMAYSHMNPQEAVLAHQDLGRPPTLSTHFGTFRLTSEAWDAPVRDLEQAKLDAGVPDEHFRALSPGEVWDVP